MATQSQPDSVIVLCKGCGKKFRAPLSAADRTARCTQCGASLQIPHQSETAPPSFLQRPASAPQPSPVSSDVPSPVRASAQPQTPKVSTPSAWLGYVIAFPVAVVLGLFIIIAFGLEPSSPWALLPALVAFGTIAEGINRARRHSTRRAAAPPPLIDDASAPQTIAPSAPSPHVPPTTSTPSRPAPSITTAGRFTEGRFVLSTSESQAIVQNPAAFANVIVFEEHSSNPYTAVDPNWYLVLSRDEAVAFRQDGSQVWTVRPDGVGLKAGFGTPQIVIQSEDGRSQPLDYDFLSFVPLLAWQANSWQDFLTAVQSLPARTQAAEKVSPAWSLLAHFLESGKNIAPFLRYAPPYRSVQEGLAMLCAQPQELALVLRTVNPKNAAKHVAALAPQHAAAFQRALHDAARRKSTAFLTVGIVLTTVGVPAIIGYVAMLLAAPPNRDDTGFVLGLGAVVLAALGTGIGLIAYGAHLRRWANRLGR